MLRVMLDTVEVNGRTIELDGVYEDSSQSTGPFDYYEIYDDTGACLNQGDMFFEYPTAEFVRKYVEEIDAESPRTDKAA